MSEPDLRRVGTLLMLLTVVVIGVLALRSATAISAAPSEMGASVRSIASVGDLAEREEVEDLAEREEVGDLVEREDIFPASAGGFAEQEQESTREPGMMFDPTDRLAPPPMSDPPTQVEQGHYAYYLSCMVCHGDRGQGLTEEWRGALDPADQNCWQSRCHAANHPPNGFELPRSAPPVIGTARLAHHQTAADLHEFLKTRMPWQAPSILSDEAYWQLTAFLVDANGHALPDTPLGPGNAAFVRLDRALATADDHPGETAAPALALIGALLLSGVLARRWLAQAG